MINHPVMRAVLESHQPEFAGVVPFRENADRIIPLDLSATNERFSESIFGDTEAFIKYIDEQLETNGATYLLGGYREYRQMYRRSALFDKDLSTTDTIIEEPRSLHLGTDIWGPAGTPVYAPLGGVVHSFAFNDHFGDYGATIILQHQLDTWNFYTLYGHLSLADIGHLRNGLFISRGEDFGHFGNPRENGNWPPHLHFQVILDISGYNGDYPGVCKLSEAEKWLANSPDPDLILNLDRFLSAGL